MNRRDAVCWLDSLRNAWKSHNIDGVLSLFDEVEEYFEGPFSPAVKDRKDIYRLWIDTQYQDIEKLEIEIISFEDGKCAMHWYLKYKDSRDLSTAEMDGTYEVHFNDNGKCIYFKQWWVMAY